MPRSSATVRCTKSWPDLGNSLALGLQRGVNTISLQCIPWPAACSEWGACLTNSKFGVLGENDPWMETFHKFLSKICASPTIQVSWPNLAKIGHCEVAKKLSRTDLLYQYLASVCWCVIKTKCHYSEMTYYVSRGTLNPAIPVHTITIT